MELKAEEEEVGGVQPVSIQAFASSSTLHGLAHIFSYERLSLKRALWALCFLGSLAVLLCVCTERVQYYFHYHHVTKLDEVAASQLTFPAVTLCNLNEFRFSQVSKNDLYHAGELLALLNNRWAAPTRPAACRAPRAHAFQLLMTPIRVLVSQNPLFRAQTTLSSHPTPNLPLTAKELRD